MQANQANQPSPVISRRTLDQLEDEICTLSQRINASEYEFLVLVREFDLRQGWKPYHFNNCAEWLNMRCGISPGTAREKIRVANSLFDLPCMSAAFQSGDLSYSKVRSLTRVATPASERLLVEYAIPATALQVDDHSRKLRNVQRELSTADARRIHRQRFLSSSCHADGSMTINIELPRESGELLLKALDMARAQMETEIDSELKRDLKPMVNGTAEERFRVGAAVGAGDGVRVGVEHRNGVGVGIGDADGDSFQAMQADALVMMARGFLAGGGDKASCTADHYQVMVHVDEEALRGEPGENSKSDFAIETVRRLCCDSAVVVVEEDSSGNPLSVGRKHRMVQPALKRALVARDQSCRFPGCTHDRWLDAHHVVHWADGGETSLDNTVLLCNRHHRALHEGEIDIRSGPDGEWQFLGGHQISNLKRECSAPIPAVEFAPRDALSTL